MKLNEIAAPRSNTTPTRFKALMFAGPPASGKSTIRELIRLPPQVEDLNTDTFRHSEAKRRGVSLNDINNERIIFSGVLDETVVFLFDMTMKGDSFVLETTADVREVFDKRVLTLRSLGYDVGLVYMHVTEQQSLEAEQKRREQEGRAVDPEFIKQSYRDMPTRLAEISNFFDKDSFLYAPRETLDFSSANVNQIQQFVNNFFSRPIKNTKGRQLAQKLDRDPDASILSITDEDAHQLYTLFAGWFN